jgi:hypothetical protein
MIRDRLYAASALTSDRTQEGARGRFAMYVPPVMEALNLADVEHNPRNNRMRAR